MLTAYVKYCDILYLTAICDENRRHSQKGSSEKIQKEQLMISHCKGIFTHSHIV